MGGIAAKEAIATAAFDALLPSYLPRDHWRRDGRLFHAGPVTIIVKATEGNAPAQGIAKADVDVAKLIVFARVLPGVPEQQIKARVVLRGFVSRNEIRASYSVTRYKTVPGYRVSVKRFKPIANLLWWLQDGGHEHGKDELHPAIACSPAEAGQAGGGGGTVDELHAE